MNPAPQPADLLIRAGWIVPVEPRATVLADHAIALRDGRITALCPAAEADAIDAAASTSTCPATCFCPAWSTPTATRR
jgi:5-methylthioadenosine/S-adenosylhomocysteine deaminase